MGEYRTAQVCRNGHPISSDLEGAPALRSQFCSECGAPALHACESCEAPIRGRYHVEGVAVLGRGYDPPAFCHACGEPHPWTAERLTAARELVRELDHLSAAEKETLEGTLEDVIHEGPRTELAASRHKRLLKKTGHEGASAMKELTINLLAETAKRMIYGP